MADDQKNDEFYDIGYFLKAFPVRYETDFKKILKMDKGVLYCLIMGLATCLLCWGLPCTVYMQSCI